jgi:Xaa-Pro aminopeptidase
MTAEFGGLGGIAGVEVMVLGDFDDPAALVSQIAGRFGLTARARIAISDRALGETVAALHRLFPEATFSSATAPLRAMRAIKTEAEIAKMREAGAITEAAFTDVLAQLRIGMTELEIITEVDFQLRRHGALGPSFTTSLYNVGPNHELIFGQREKPGTASCTRRSRSCSTRAVHEGFCYDYGRTVALRAGCGLPAVV